MKLEVENLVLDKPEVEAKPKERSRKGIRMWLLIGVIMLVGQVVIGGITRLTESGLSITEWEPLSGALPPLNEADWQIEFDKYKASPQFEKVFADISMSDFKFIYFWEWFHRQWARIMGLVFAIGFAYFAWKRRFTRRDYRWLGLIVALAGLAATFGWIMVASGLIDRPWVDAYKLTMHLSIALSAFSALLWYTYKNWFPEPVRFPQLGLKTPLMVLTIVAIVQIVLGGIMSGARAALVFPQWPDMAGRFFPATLADGSNWTVENFVEYDQSPFLPALVQFSHRMTAYLLVIITLWFVWKAFKSSISPAFKRANFMLITVLIIQVLLGIFTLLNAQGEVPVGLGVAHQAGAVVLLSVVLYLNYLFNPGRSLLYVDNDVGK
ncbi:MAG: COX15/CtaA family protein [Bacteroidota bacterium]